MKTKTRTTAAVSLLAGLLVLPALGATFTVNSADDTNDGVCDATPCSLREAINAANANTSDLDTIAFNIPGPGVHTITPSQKPPWLSGPVIIDGYTQPGAAPNTLTVGDDAVLLIEVNFEFVGEGFFISA